MTGIVDGIYAAVKQPEGGQASRVRGIVHLQVAKGRMVIMMEGRVKKEGRQGEEGRIEERKEGRQERREGGWGNKEGKKEGRKGRKKAGGSGGKL